MLFKRKIWVILAGLTMLIFHNSIYSQVPEQYYQSIKGKQVDEDSSFTVIDDKWDTPAWDDIDTILEVRNLVAFSINDDTTYIQKKPFTCDITIKIESIDSTGDTITMFKTLSVNFDTGAVIQYKTRDVFAFKGGHKVIVTIENIDYTETGWGGILPPVFIVSAEIFIERKYEFSCSDYPDMLSNIQSNKGLIQIGWSSVDGAEEYDLEWTFYGLTSELIQRYLTNPSEEFSNYDSLFKFNASRVSLNENAYYIPNVYDSGYVFYRVRAVQYDTENGRIEAVWSNSFINDTTFTNYEHKEEVYEHEPTINWQYQVLYAEEGKKLPSINYMDGALKGRQNVVRSDGINKTIISEMFYDHQGRPAVQALPAPDTTNLAKIKYYDSFNTRNDTVYNRIFFDTSGCDFEPYPMDSVSGAAYFYSNNNNDNNKAIHKYIPKALGYPFTVTEYTPDLTGRISKQSNVGKELRMGAGRETRYFYVAPAREEIDRLFGNEVGFTGHYFKNMIVDPNGGISISYLDASGHVVATAMAGEAPDNLSTLNSNTGADTLTISLLISNDTSEQSIIQTYPYVPEMTGEHTFEYSFVPYDYVPECVSEEICFDCLYDLTIEITDMCGNCNLPDSEAVIITKKNYSIGTLLDSLCENPSASFDTTFTVNLIALQEYHITKKITVSDAGKEQYTDTYIRNDTCLKTLDFFRERAWDDIDTTGCNITCESCFEDIGTEEEYLDEYITGLQTGGYVATAIDTIDAEELYATAVVGCDEICDSISTECEGLYASILNDVSPGGQYALYNLAGGIYSPRDTSILNVATAVGDFGDSYATLSPYNDENGEQDTVWLDGVGYLPQNLPLKYFIENFKESWAATLAPLHPEFCFYEFCSDHEDVYQYAAEMLFTETYSAALAKGYMNPLGENPDVNTGLYSSGLEVTYNDPGDALTDPLFESGAPGYTSWAQMDDSIKNLGSPTSDTTIWMIASMVSNCFGVCDTIPGFTDSCSANADMAWIVYRALYLAKRSSIIKEILNDSIGCDNDNIGVSGLFENKIKRVYFSSDAYALAEYDTAAMADEMDITCESYCESMSFGWMALLEGCIGPADTAAVRAGLIEVCASGCDPDHPFGSSTTPGGIPTAGGYISFADVLEQEAGILLEDTVCNATLITWPDPYDHPSNPGQETFVGDVDSCVCENISYYHALFVEDSIGEVFEGNFEEYMLQYQSDLSESELYEILDVCEGSCKWVSQPIDVPGILTCNGCTDCKTLSQTYAAFLNLYGTLDFENYETYLTNFMNDQLGYNLPFFDYQMMLDSCAYTIGSSCFECPYFVTYNEDSADFLICNDPLFPTLEIDTTDCLDYLAYIAEANAVSAYTLYIDSVKNAFWGEYVGQCLDSLTEMFSMDKLFNQYHYTLYYYDQSGNLVKTVPPLGVDFLNTAELEDVLEYRTNVPGSSAVYPTHNYATRYHYNTLNQLIKQENPDGGAILFWYDRLGRIIASQNEKQEPNDQYSYTLYDGLGRPYQAGQFENSSMTFAIALDNGDLQTWLAAGTNKVEVINTFFDDIAIPLDDPFGGAGQENLRNRISSVTWEAVDDDDSLTYDFATHYSYDIAGNVKVLVQEIGPLRVFDKQFKRIDYEYDLISGKVNKVWYQKDSIDQFGYWYIYDNDNRLITAYTSADGLLWDMDANYMYYDHGPLARVELGSRQVQGLDYAYTLSGWLKGMNGDALDPNKEMGIDGKPSGAHQFIARDAAGFSLSYFINDYKPIGATNFEASYSTTAGFGASSPSLYNGNVRRATYALDKLDDKTIGYSYSYDQLNRLIGMRAWTNFNAGSYAWPGSGSASSKWREDVNYDANGNILTYFRNGNASTMDNMTYRYKSHNNQLIRVDDAVSSGTYSVDIDDQSGTNYSYDSLGNLVKDVAEQIDTILWTLTGKIDSISRTGASTKDELKFYYDAMGNRVGKIVYQDDGDVIKTWYIRDGRGNIMATYREQEDSIWWSEQDIFGSTRLGVIYPDSLIHPNTYVTPTDTFTFFNTAGNKRYEITNHLGNVLGTITDRKIPQEIGTPDSIAEYYLADISSINDYYPFGMVMPTRSFEAGNDYRYGFNGKESDDETYGDGNLYDYGFRIYNPRLGKFLSKDPLANSYPWYTPYQFAGNKPIWAIDLDGLEELEATQITSGPGGFYPGSVYYVYNKTKENLLQSEWFEMDRKTISGSINNTFVKASYENTVAVVNGGTNYNFYQSIAQRHAYYDVAHYYNAKYRDSYWFKAASAVTDWNAVGGAELTNFGFLSEDSEDLLTSANIYLFEANMKNFGPWLLKRGEVKGAEGLSGQAFDNKLVEIEQNELENFLINYKTNYLKNHSQAEWDDMTKNINNLFNKNSGNGYSLIAMNRSEAFKYGINKFHEKYGSGMDFDFMNKEHRIFIGQAMAEYFRIEDKKK